MDDGDARGDMSLRDDLSLPFLLGLSVAGLVAADYLFVPELLSAPPDVTLTYGGLLVALALAYGYRPLRESRYGAAATALFLMLFAAVQYALGIREPLVPYGLFGVSLVAFYYELYKLGTDRHRRGPLS